MLKSYLEFHYISLCYLLGKVDLWTIKSCGFLNLINQNDLSHNKVELYARLRLAAG